MTIRNAAPGPCWIVVDLSTGQHADTDADNDGMLAHHPEFGKATADLLQHLRDWDANYGDEIDEVPPRLGLARAFPRPCIEFVCDHCGAVLDDSEHGDEGATHLDPTSRLADSVLAALGWTELGTLHHCGRCERLTPPPVQIHPDQILLGLDPEVLS